MRIYALFPQCKQPDAPLRRRGHRAAGTCQIETDDAPGVLGNVIAVVRNG